jgi:hypothetical protein
MTHGTPSHDLVAVSSTLSFPQDIALFDQLGEDPVGRALGDAYRSGDVAQPDARIMGHAQENVGVVCQKVPAGGGRGRPPLHFISRK